MDYKIVFKTEADLKAARDLLKNTTEQTAAQKELKAATDAANKSQADRIRANVAASRQGRDSSGFGDNSGAAEARIQRRLAAQREENKVVEEGAAATDKFTFSNKQAAQAIKQFSHEIPGLGVAIAALKNPYIGAAAAAAALMAVMRSLTEEHNRSAAAAAANSSTLQNTVGPLRAVADIAREAAEAEQALNDALHQIVVDANRAGVELGKEKDVIEQRLQAKRQEIELEKKLALARLETSRAAGLDPAEYARRKAAIEGKSDKDIAAAGEAAEKEKANAAAAALFKEQERAAEAQKALPGLRATLAGKRKQLQRAVELEGAAEPQRARLEEELRKELEAAELDAAGITDDDLNRGSAERRRHFADKLADAQARREAAQSGLSGIAGARQAQKDRISQLKGGVESQQGLVTSTEGQLTDSTRAADQLLQQVLQSVGSQRARAEAAVANALKEKEGAATAAIENMVESLIQMVTGERVRVDADMNALKAKVDAAARETR